MRRLETSEISKSYRGRRVVDDVSVFVQQGEVVGLLGPNGAGKTTTFYMIVGLIVPDSGRVMVDEEDITTFPMYQRARRGISYLPQEASVFRKLTVEENLRVGAYREPSDKVAAARLAEILQIFPRLAERRTQLAGTMSGGEQAMVSIGRGLMCAPKLLLIDEPSLGLSPRLVKENFDIIRGINERGITVLLVEQNVHQTLAISHYGFVLSKGRVAASGAPAELAARQEVRDAYFG